jgi:methionyl-tRNA formyltransferase
MRILFAGSPDFAVPSLATVHRNFPVTAVLTNPDRPVGRGKQPVATPVKRKAVELGIPVLQPQALDQSFLDQVRVLEVELLVVVAFGRIFSREFLQLFPLGGINLHASLLPKYRGPSPITAAILGGDRKTGVTVQKLAARMDAGDILGSRVLPLSGTETTGSLSEVLAAMGAELLPDILGQLEQGCIDPRPQEESQVSYCRLVHKDDGLIDWSSGAVTIERMIRAYDPWPRAYTTWRGQRLNLLSGGVHPEPVAPAGASGGLVFDTDNRYGILINTGSGALYVSSLQLQARKPLDWRSFSNGQKDFVGAQLGEQR